MSKSIFHNFLENIIFCQKYSMSQFSYIQPGNGLPQKKVHGWLAPRPNFSSQRIEKLWLKLAPKVICFSPGITRDQTIFAGWSRKGIEEMSIVETTRVAKSMAESKSSGTSICNPYPYDRFLATSTSIPRKMYHLWFLVTHVGMQNQWERCATTNLWMHMPFLVKF